MHFSGEEGKGFCIGEECEEALRSELILTEPSDKDSKINRKLLDNSSISRGPPIRHRRSAVPGRSSSWAL